MVCRVASLVGLAWLVAGCAPQGPRTPAGSGGPETITLADWRGKQVTLPCPPRRIVSLTPANTEILFALGAGSLVVADTAYCNFPPEAARLPHVGDSTISLEQVVGHRPDLVLAGGKASAQYVGPLERSGQCVFTVEAETVDGVCRAIETVGRIAARPGEASSAVKAIRERIGKVRSRVEAAAVKPRVLIVLQSQPLWVAGSGTFVGEVVELAGGINVGAAAGDGYQTLSPERVVSLAPDVIIASVEDLDAIRLRAGWSRVPAVSRGRVIAPDADLLNRPGPRVGEGVALLAGLLHPKPSSRRQ